VAGICAREPGRTCRHILDTTRDSQQANQLLDLTSATHREAERFLLTLGRHVPLRAADSLHLAAAALADARALVTYDRQMHAAVLALGAFEVVPVSP
jgi:hypothetical protein